MMNLKEVIQGHFSKFPNYMHIFWKLMDAFQSQVEYIET